MPTPRLHVRGLDGTLGSLKDSIQTLQEMRPKQVMLETCDQRRMLAERRQASAAAS